MNTKKNIVIVAHKFLTQPDDEFVLFLNNRKQENVLHIKHSFSDAKDRCSYFTWYKKGQVYKEIRSKDYTFLPEPLIYGKELVLTILWIVQSCLRWDYYIGMDGLCVLFGTILRFIRRIKKTIFWAIDFVPENRFNAGLKNKIYSSINMHGYKNSDEMWDLGPRMHEARKEFLGLEKKDYKAHKVVPYGVWGDRIIKYDYDQCEKYTIVFMGHLLEKQGAQLIISVIPQIIKKYPKFKFKIIGTGSYKDELIALSKKLHVEKYCNFMGKIEDHKELEEEIAKSAIAVAPYIRELDTWTKYADPGKVKTYLACGVPVLLTDVPWNSAEIQYNKCGFIVSQEAGDIVNKIDLLFHNKTNQLFRKNSTQYAKTFNYETIFRNCVDGMS